ncbi:DUF803-domain-containing protein [Wilcoxina mikolae CBS 423.85]|nr:DUF803-domain-containing protein [Wilcoxina mikolae CBS 423.85]
MAGGSVSTADRPPIFKAVGVSLAVASGVFIGVSFVLKKKGLLAANLKDGKEAGEGYGYLRNAWWWTGMILMIIGEICNFAAYAFVEAILVTPLGALSVVITAILSSIFLQERLSFIGKIGCFMCIIGSVVIVVNAPAQSSVSTIQDMQRFILSPGFLSYAGIVVVGCICIIVWIAPKYGNQSMMVYLTVCSLIGGLSVVATQGLGAAVVAQARGTPQFNHWFLYVLLVFVVVTLLVEIVYLNKALNIFNAALVTPTYYVIFTSATIVTSAILFRGFKGSPSSIATVVMGFLQICSGVVLLQLSKSSKNVPDTEIFRGDLDQIRTVAEQSEPESEPKADAIRGTAAIIRRLSVARQQAEVDEARKIYEERVRDLHTPLPPGELVEWDGVRRRVTISGASRGPPVGTSRRNTLSGQHPPLGMSRIPDEEEGVIPEEQQYNRGRRRSMSVDEAMRQRVYGGAPIGEEPHPESFLGRMRGLFIPKVRSRASLKDADENLAATGSPHRDIRDASASGSTPALPSGRPRFYTAEGPLKPPILGSFQQAASQSSPQVNHVTFEPPAETKSHDFASASSRRTHSRGSEYQSVPTNTVVPPPSPSGSAAGKKPKDSLRPESRHGARRQFSFQFLHRHGRSDSTGSSSADMPESAGLGWKQKLPVGSGAAKTEEEMLGLVKGDSNASTITTARSRSVSPTSPSEKVPDVRVVEHEDDIPAWSEKGYESRGP